MITIAKCPNGLKVQLRCRSSLPPLGPRSKKGQQAARHANSMVAGVRITECYKFAGVCRRLPGTLGMRNAKPEEAWRPISSSATPILALIFACLALFERTVRPQAELGDQAFGNRADILGGASIVEAGLFERLNCVRRIRRRDYIERMFDLSLIIRPAGMRAPRSYRSEEEHISRGAIPTCRSGGCEESLAPVARYRRGQRE